MIEKSLIFRGGGVSGSSLYIVNAPARLFLGRVCRDLEAVLPLTQDAFMYSL